ncbi:MAG: hypothetical protein FD126_2174 [Elusimicrobia bacterium]|nr:MAG: hypothetical protein FD126_2174 [Elusimicrobiota bacterium]
MAEPSGAWVPTRSFFLWGAAVFGCAGSGVFARFGASGWSGFEGFASAGLLLLLGLAALYWGWPAFVAGDGRPVRWRTPPPAVPREEQALLTLPAAKSSETRTPPPPSVWAWWVSPTS